MTDIQALKDAVVSAAKCAWGREAGDAARGALMHAVDRLVAAEEAAKRPRLRTPVERATRGLNATNFYSGRINHAICAVQEDRADILAKAQELPRWFYHHTRRDFTQTKDGAWVNLNDLADLIGGR